MTYKTYQTDRLFIRPTTQHDAEFILELLNTPKWLAFIGDRNVRTLLEAEKYIETKMLPQLQKLGFSNNTLIRKSDQKKIGCCGLYDRDGVDGLDIGFAFLPEFEGQGYGYEAAAKLLDVAKTEYKVKTINAITDQHNMGSQRLLQKLGFELMGTTRLPNALEDIFLFKKNIDL